MAAFPPPPSQTLPIKTTTTFLSSTQLGGIADKLSSLDDRQKYRQVITLSSTIQTKLNQIRLDHMNAISFNTRQETIMVEKNSEVCESLTKKTDHYRSCSTLLITTSTTAPLPETHSLERRDSAVEITLPKSDLNLSQSSPSLSVDKALPALESNSNKYDSIFDTTSYYYEKQQEPIDWAPPCLPPKTTNVTFTEHLGLPSPSSLTPTAFENPGNHHNPNSNNMDPSFLLITPPESPRYIDYIPAPPTPLYKEQQPLPLPPIIHCQRRINGFLGFLTRTYQINEIISSRVLISSLGLFNAMDSSTGLEKAVLKVTLTSNQTNVMELENTLDNMMVELFGFTFYASVKRSPNVKRPTREDSHCLAVSDYLVLDALDYWIHHQRDGLPYLANATHILRDSVKIYVVYDKALLLHSPY